MYLLIYSHDRATPLAACKDKYSAYTVIRKHYERTIGRKFKHQEDFSAEPVDDAFRDLMAQSMGEDNDKDKESLMPLAITLDDIPDGWTQVTYHKNLNDSPDSLKLAVAAVLSVESELKIQISTRPSWVIPGGMDDWLDIIVSGHIDKINNTHWEDRFKIQSRDWRQMLRLAAAL
jgi:hypothetical protein